MTPATTILPALLSAALAAGPAVRPSMAAELMAAVVAASVVAAPDLADSDDAQTAPATPADAKPPSGGSPAKATDGTDTASDGSTVEASQESAGADGAQKPPAREPPVQLQVLPRPIPLARIYEYLTKPITDDAARTALEVRIKPVWEAYVGDFALPNRNEFGEVRGILSQIPTDRPPSPDEIRNKYASALAVVDRLDASFLTELAAMVGEPSRPALEALRRARLRSVASIGVAGHLSLSVPMRWVDPMVWLQVTETTIPGDAVQRFDLEVTRISQALTPVRRRFEFEMVVRARSQQQLVAALPTKGKEFVAASREAARASMAAVDALKGPLAAEDVARVHIARIEDLYFDTPKPERPLGAESFPSDPAARDAWFAERAKLAIADAEILLRYEAAALTTLAATPLWDRDAYDGRQLLAKSFGDERTRLHDETRSRLELISGKQ